MNLLPDSLKMAAHQLSPELSACLVNLVAHVSKLPMPNSCGRFAAVDMNGSEAPFEVHAGTVHGQNTRLVEVKSASSFNYYIKV